MPQYRYQARHPSGQIQAGVLAANSAATAAAILRKNGHHLLQLVPVQTSAAQWSSRLKALNYSSGPSQKDILDFTTQLAVMIRAGIALRLALDGIADQVSNPKGISKVRDSRMMLRTAGVQSITSTAGTNRQLE